MKNELTKKEKAMRLEHYNMINEELAFAQQKHPNFCDKFTGTSLPFQKKILQEIRKTNDLCETFLADRILREEVLEACVAYLEGDYDHCLQELAQCGAVILRMMEFVQNEKESKK